jgi:hypothetical protein
MKTTRRLLATFAIVGATQLALAACSGGSDAPVAGSPPSRGSGPFVSGGVVDAGGLPDAVGSGVPTGCPSTRTDAPDEIDEAIFRARIVGIYRVCELPGVGIEVRVDSATDGIVWYELDGRFVRTGGANGRIEVQSCIGDQCIVDWVASRSGGPEETSTRTLGIWTDPVAVRAMDGMFPAAWLRVSD